MPANRGRFGRVALGLGVMGLALICLMWGDFVPGQPVVRTIPHRVLLAYCAGALMLVAAAAVEWRRSAAWGGAVLTVYYGLFVVLLMNGRVLLAHSRGYGAYDGLAEQVAITAGALIVYASNARIGAAKAARLIRVGQVAFAVCALVFGGAHFVYMNLTAPLVPKWLPPSQVFWGYATGVCFFAAGIAMRLRIMARLAAILLTVMLGCFAVLVHVPILLADHRSRENWSEAVLNFAIMGAAWVVTDSFGRSAAQRSGPRG